ncbi:unnamed protein product, partial [Allacma fusca]
IQTISGFTLPLIVDKVDTVRESVLSVAKRLLQPCNLKTTWKLVMCQ